MRPKNYLCAFKLGHEAYTSGIPEESNPYNNDEPEWGEWLDGFVAAENLYLGVDYDG